MVGAAAVITRSVPPNAIVVGNPARITGYVDTMHADSGDRSKPTLVEDGASTSEATRIGGVTLHSLPKFSDIRGDLAVGEFASEIPFTPKRFFLVYSVPSEDTRGEHAHRACHQFLVCVHGQCSVVVDEGSARRELKLDSPTKGLHIPPLIWAIQYKYSPDAVLLVFASEAYDPDDYIRDYDEFLDALPDRA